LFSTLGYLLEIIIKFWRFGEINSSKSGLNLTPLWAFAAFDALFVTSFAAAAAAAAAVVVVVVPE